MLSSCHHHRTMLLWTAPTMACSRHLSRGMAEAAVGLTGEAVSSLQDDVGVDIGAHIGAAVAELHWEAWEVWEAGAGVRVFELVILIGLDP